LDQVQAIGHSAAQLASTSAQRVRAGDLAAQDAARTEIEARRAEGDVRLAELDQQRAAAALSQVLGRPATAPLQAAPDWPRWRRRAPARLNALVEARADVRAAQARVDAAQAALDNAQALTRNDLTLGASLDHYPGTSTRQLELRLSMPLQTHYAYQGEIARALAGLNQARTQLERVRLAALLELQRLQQSLRPRWRWRRATSATSCRARARSRPAPNWPMARAPSRWSTCWTRGARCAPH
jgi:cobalt-zinc-cadmium efflux system outer membrane protein